MTTSRVALLIGGPARLHNASLSAASDILELPSMQLASLHPILITPRGQWRLYSSGLGYAADTPQQVLESHQILTQLPFLYDAAFITLVGEFASDGQLQRMLDRAGMPYQGSGSRASARTWDRAGLFQFLRRVGFHIPSYLALNRAEWVVARGRKLRQLIAAMGLDLIVKPNSRIDETEYRTDSQAELADAIEEVSVRYDSFIVQRRLKGMRVWCGVIEAETGAVPGQPITDSDMVFAPEVALALQRVALQIHQVLKLRDYSLVEMMIAHGRIWIIDVETLPHLGSDSYFVRSVMELGWRYPDVISHLVGRALSRPEVIELHT